MAEILSLDRVSSGYGEALVVRGVSLALEEGRSLAVLGRNGVGKTTLLDTIIGVTRHRGGTIRLAGRDITRLTPEARAAAGAGWVPQERNIFRSLTVEENLTAVQRPGPWNVPAVYRLFPRIAERRRNLGSQLSGGEQQMLAIARALLTNPRLVLMDEPSDGLAPAVVDLIGEAIGGMKAEGVTLVVVEQDLHLAFAVADDIAVMDKGVIVHRSTTREFRSDSSVAHSLLGVA